MERYISIRFNNLAAGQGRVVAIRVHQVWQQQRSCRVMKKSMYVLFAVAALLAGGRLSAHGLSVASNHSASVMQAADDETSSPDPAGDPDGLNGPDGGPDGEAEGGPGAA
jgi:hypothetical protein